MPAFSSHNNTKLVKMLLVGDSGSGKTGSLASLANAGYNLRILDFDNGLDILQSYLTPEGISRVSFQALQDKIIPGTLGPVVAGSTAFQGAMRALNSWDTFGNATTWGADTILVMDSLTFFSDAALTFVLQMNGRLNQHPQIQDYGEAMDLIENLISFCSSDALKCHFIANTHISYIGEKAYPMALGKKLPPKIPRYFNTVVRAKTVGVGQSLRRVIATVSDPDIELKTTAPNKIPPELPLADGILTIFKVLRGELGTSVPPASNPVGK